MLFTVKVEISCYVEVMEISNKFLRSLGACLRNKVPTNLGTEIHTPIKYQRILTGKE